MGRIHTMFGRCHTTPSKEIKIKKNKLKNYKDNFSEVESIVFDVAGGISMDNILKLQRRIKEDTGLRTSRVDWRTKTGIILWFCENWEKINPVLHKYKASPAQSEEVSESQEVSEPAVTPISAQPDTNWEEDIFNFVDIPLFQFEEEDILGKFWSET